MGISGIFKEIGQGKRISLVKLASDHYVAHDRPLRLAIDISIWLFQIQAGKGGSNPALRTFYYRLLRLLSLNIHPLFVFDGPNKPKFKRNKKVGGPGVKVVNVPEFLAKQLLKQFGFPQHVAPGEAEAECALLQKEGIVDAVLSDDVDTLMFGSDLTLRNWTPEGTSKTPTHVNVYRADETKTGSGLDQEGMILVALMSGGDYVPEGIPGCGIRFACDAARAGFGKEMCDLMKKKDNAGMKRWREQMQHELRTNESKFFSRKNSRLIIPEEFPDQEILGYYTNPCLSTPDKLERLRKELQWDKDIDFAALRSFAADAFDWRCLSGAKKFIRNLAPALLVRQLRLRADEGAQLDHEVQAERENTYVTAIHGKRNHKTTDAELEYRVTYVPMNFVPIDLGIEDEDEEIVPAGVAEGGDGDVECSPIPHGTDDEGEPPPTSPTKKRTLKPYEPDQPEKIWMMHSFLKVGCPLLVEDYESSLRDPKEIFKQRRKARTAAAGSSNVHVKKTAKKTTSDMPEGALDKYTAVKKTLGTDIDQVDKPRDREPLKIIDDLNTVAPRQRYQAAAAKNGRQPVAEVSGFKLPSTQLSPPNPQKQIERSGAPHHGRLSKPLKPRSEERPFLPFVTKKPKPDPQTTPKRQKRPLSDVITPNSMHKSSASRQQSIAAWLSPSPKKTELSNTEYIDLISSTPARPEAHRACSPTPVAIRSRAHIDAHSCSRRSFDLSPDGLPSSVTKRRKNRGPLKRIQTAPVLGEDLDEPLPTLESRPLTLDVVDLTTMETDQTWSRPVEFLHPITSTRPTEQSFDAQPVARAKDQRPPVQDNFRSSITKDAPTVPSLNAQARTQRPAHQSKKKKTLIMPRESLPGAWKEVDAEIIDCTGDGSGYKFTQGKAKMIGIRKSGIEVVDMTGA